MLILRCGGLQIHRTLRRTSSGTGKVGAKEFREIKGIRPDFVDFENHRIYELKPYNPWSVRRGIKQLNKYQKSMQSYDLNNPYWETILEFY